MLWRNKDVYNKIPPSSTYVITIHQRYRRPDRCQTVALVPECPTVSL